MTVTPRKGDRVNVTITNAEVAEVSEVSPGALDLMNGCWIEMGPGVSVEVIPPPVPLWEQAIRDRLEAECGSDPFIDNVVAAVRDALAAEGDKPYPLDVATGANPYYKKKSSAGTGHDTLTAAEQQALYDARNAAEGEGK
jgi:hypothetical protein